jgi:hypothetical protein
VIVIGGTLATAGLLLATLLRPGNRAAGVCAGGRRLFEYRAGAVFRRRQAQVMPEHIAVPAITTLGYAGILAGPAVIGFIAHGSSLSTAFVLIALLAAVAVSGKAKGLGKAFSAPCAPRPVPANARGFCC